MMQGGGNFGASSRSALADTGKSYFQGQKPPIPQAHNGVYSEVVLPKFDNARVWTSDGKGDKGTNVYEIAFL